MSRMAGTPAPPAGCCASTCTTGGFSIPHQVAARCVNGDSGPEELGLVIRVRGRAAQTGGDVIGLVSRASAVRVRAQGRSDWRGRDLLSG